MLSVYGSMKISDAFYTKYAVYKDAQDTPHYVTPRLIEEVTGKEARGREITSSRSSFSLAPVVHKGVSREPNRRTTELAGNS